MTLEPRPASGDALREVREAAQRQARALPTGLVLMAAIAVAVAVVGLFVLLDYRFEQDPHRLVKVLLGASLISGMMLWPRIGLLALPIVTPFLLWIPKLKIPGVNPVNILLFCVFFFWAMGRGLRRQPIYRRGRLDLLLLGVVLLAGLSVIRGAAFPTGYSYDASDAGLQFFRCSMTFTVYFIGFAMVRGARDRRMLAWALVLGLIAEAVVTILYGRIGRGGRATGSFGQSNDLGSFLALFTVLAAALIPASRRLLARLVLAGAVAAGAFAVLLTVSRGAMAALAVGLLFVGIKSSRLLTFLLVAALLTSPLWTPDFVKQRVLGTQVESDASDELSLESSSQLRVDTWHAVIDVVTHHPLDGVGFAGLGYVLPEAGSALGVDVKDSAHNTYLRFLGEMGVLGLALFIWLLWSCFKLARDGAALASSPFDRQLCVGLMASTLALAASCALGDRFFPIIITGNFWLLCALVNDVLAEAREAAA